MGKNYFVWYNGIYLHSYRTIAGCMNYIHRRFLKSDENNTLCICDDEGNIVVQY